MNESLDYESLILSERSTTATKIDNQIVANEDYSTCGWGKGVLDEVRKAIVWDENATPTVKSFKYNEQVLYAINSTPRYWSTKDIRPLRTDLVVISKSPEEAQREFEEIIQAGERIRDERVKEVLPLIAHLQSEEKVKLILGRGTAYDTRRVYMPEDDIDIMLVLDWKTEEELVELIKYITNIAGQFGKEKRIKIVGKTGEDKGGGWSFSKPGSPLFLVNLDLIPFEFFGVAQKSRNSANFLLGDEYLQDMFRHTEFLGGELKYSRWLNDLLNLGRKG